MPPFCEVRQVRNSDFFVRQFLQAQRAQWKAATDRSSIRAEATAWEIKAKVKVIPGRTAKASARSGETGGVVMPASTSLPFPGIQTYRRVREKWSFDLEVTEEN